MKIRSDRAKNIVVRRQGGGEPQAKAPSGLRSTRVVTKVPSEPSALLSETLFEDAERGELYRGKAGLLRWSTPSRPPKNDGSDRIPSFKELPVLADRLKAQAFPGVDAVWPPELARIVDCLTPIIGEALRRRLRRPGQRGNLEYNRWPGPLWMIITKIIWARATTWPAKRLSSRTAWRKELNVALERSFRVRSAQQSPTKADVMLELPRTLPQWQVHNQLWASRVRGLAAKRKLSWAQTQHVFFYASWAFQEGFFTWYSSGSRRSPAAFEEFSEKLYFPALSDALEAAYPSRAAKAGKNTKPFKGGQAPHFETELLGGLRGSFNRLRARHRKSRRKGGTPPAHWRVHEEDATISSDASGILDLEEAEKYRKAEHAGDPATASRPAEGGEPVSPCVETYVEFMKIWRGLAASLGLKERVSRAYDLLEKQTGFGRGMLIKRVYDGQRCIEDRLGGKA